LLLIFSGTFIGDSYQNAKVTTILLSKNTTIGIHWNYGTFYLKTAVAL